MRYKTLCLTFAVAACGHPADFHERNNPTKQIVVLSENYKVGVIKIADDTYESFGGNKESGWPDDYVKFKGKLSEGIERVSGCKVIDSVFTQETLRLQAKVRCGK